MRLIGLVLLAFFLLAAPAGANQPYAELAVEEVEVTEVAPPEEDGILKALWSRVVFEQRDRKIKVRLKAMRFQRRGSPDAELDLDPMVGKSKYGLGFTLKF